MPLGTPAGSLSLRYVDGQLNVPGLVLAVPEPRAAALIAGVAAAFFLVLRSGR